MPLISSVGTDFDIRLLADAVRTAKLAAQALDCEVGQIANSLILRDVNAQRAVLIIGAGERNFGDSIPVSSRLPPLRSGSVKQVYCPSRFLQRHAELWAAAGTPESVFRITPAQLEQITGGAWYDLILD